MWQEEVAVAAKEQARALSHTRGDTSTVKTTTGNPTVTATPGGHR